MEALKKREEKMWEKSRQKRMLQAAGARLARPKLTAAVTFWKRDWKVDKEAKATARREARLAEEKQGQEASEAEMRKEIKRLRTELEAAHKAAVVSGNQGASLQAQHEQMLEEEREKKKSRLDGGA